MVAEQIKGGGMDKQKLDGLIRGTLDSLYDLKSELDKMVSEENLTVYIKDRFNSGKSIRQISRELGWGRNKLIRFCDGLEIQRPSQAVCKEKTNPQPPEPHQNQSRADLP